MNARIAWQGGVKFEATSGTGHSITIDGPEKSGGQNAGARPMELVLIGVGACAAYDVVTILEKSRENVSNCVASVDGVRADETPAVFTHIKMHFVVSGTALTESKVERAVRLSADKYCSASIMLARAGVTIEHSFEIVDE